MPAWNIGDSTRTDRHMQYGAGGAQHPESRMWQLWVTFDGQAINWVAAWNDKRYIDEAMTMLKRIGGEGTLFDPVSIIKTLDQIYISRQAEPQPWAEAEQMIRQNVAGQWKGGNK